MPKVGQRTVSVYHGGRYGTKDNKGNEVEPIHCNHIYDIHVNTHGNFYATMPDHLVEAAGTLTGKRSSRHPYRMQVFDLTMAGLEKKLYEIHEAYLDPKVTKVLVIRYNIQTDVSFATTPDGTIFPNAGCHDEACWHVDDKRYGNLSATSRANGGYSLSIGAQAETKITRQYGNGATRVAFEMYYGDDSHLGFTHPAARLNAWQAWSLSDWKCQTIPYTDEAAEFFYNLMFGMAELSRRIQDSVFSKKDLLKLIESRQKLLGAPAEDKS